MPTTTTTHVAPTSDLLPPWAEPPARISPPARIGERLLEDGLITCDVLDRALELQQKTSLRLGETLVAMGAVTSRDFTAALARQLHFAFVDLELHAPENDVAAVIVEEVARRYEALPIAEWEGQIVVAMSNPADVFALDDLRVMIDRPILSVMAEPEQLQLAIERTYRHENMATTLDVASNDYADDSQPLTVHDDSADASVVRLVNALLERAVSERASDVHIEPSSHDVRLRFRVDGVLHDASRAPLSLLRPIVSRVKVMSGLDIAQARLPQDGRFSCTIDGRSIDMRVATVPTAGGESLVLRLLDHKSGVRDIASLGMTPRELDRYEPIVRAPQGAIFVSGPTGSGKTSTVYASLSAINNPMRSIVSVEDPVEYRLDGTKQIQVNPRAGLTFPTALRSILRADPDVVFVGEVRDAETARIATDAAITGHLVLSTLHTTRAAAVPLRLVDMGVEPFLVSSALTCVVAQRLGRKLCEHCAHEFRDPDLSLLKELGAPEDVLAGAKIRSAAGCPSCADSGYSGRTAIYEIMPISEGIARLVLERASAADIQRLAVEEGMDTLRVAALRRVASGEIGIDEMLRVIA